jgi:NhaA family Na+:H+ antiporter
LADQAAHVSGARRAWAFTLDHSLLLVVGAAAGLVWANVDLTRYQRVVHILRFVVNDIGMAFFFALAAKEVVEATAPRGALHSPRRAAMPLFAAVGGMVGPALILIGLALATGTPQLLSGWAVPCATDIAFSYLAARLIFGAKHPAIPFLLLLAIADDALGLVVLAVFYPTGMLRPVEFAVLLGVALGIAVVLRRRAHTSFWSYIIGAGVVSWLAFFRGGLHPALALVPIIPFVPHARSDEGLFARSAGHDPLSAFEHWWKTPVQLILLVFGLVNAGVPISNTGPGTWIVLASILIGKPVGILSLVALGSAFGLHRPAGVTWRDLVVVGVAAAVGFTVALFFATAAFPEGPLLDQVKMGALLSFFAAPLAALAALALHVGKKASYSYGEPA